MPPRRSAPALDARTEGVFSRVDAMTLEDCPIDPGWVRAGRPQARAATHAMARDGLSSTHLWECSAGAFAWRFSVEETVLILDGEVRVTSPGGQVRTLRAGDVGHFPAHTTWLWEVDRHVRKIAFCRREVPWPLRLATRGLDRLLERARALKAAGAAWRRGGRDAQMSSAP